MAITLPEADMRGGYRILLSPTSWKGYKQVLADLDAQGRRYRSTYSDGILEVLVPGPIHEAVKKCAARLLETYSLATGEDITGMGSTTFDSELKKKGLEPDECYYVDGNVPQPGRVHLVDGAPMNPPDLAIEVDVTTSSIPREPVYAALGVRELWRWQDDAFAVRYLSDGKYIEIESSRVLPNIPLVQFAKFVQMAMESGNQSAVAREWFDWLKQHHAK